MVRMKARIEAANLRHIWQALEDGIDGCEVVWLVQRSQWDEFVQIRKYLARHQHRFAVPHPAMNNAVSNTKHTCATPLRSEPRCQCVDGSVPISNGGIQTVVCKDYTLGILCAESWRCPDALNLAARRDLPILLVGSQEDAKLQTR